MLFRSHGEYSSEAIYNAAAAIRTDLLNGKDLKGERVAILCPPGLSFAASMLSCWMSGGMAVPLCIDHPASELDHVITDSGSVHILAHPSFLEKIERHRPKIIEVTHEVITGIHVPLNWNLPRPDDHALMLYTSGTTGKPKGVVHTHGSLISQIECLVEAWEWNEHDRILHFLPLHHTHGLVNKLLCSLYSGARCDMMEKFNADEVVDRIANGSYTIFMAVPTVYVKLIEKLNLSVEHLVPRFREKCGNMRVMISGSAALQIAVMEKWMELTGQRLLERYGMTEIGMALSNPLHGDRKIGSVGMPLPGMEVRLLMDNALIEGNGEGELEVHGKNIFSSYWQRPDETKKSFTADGWFRTGDLVERKENYYYIRGRLSTDIIKSGGYKISALEIESVLSQHPAISECAIIGVPDETWGERIIAVVIMKKDLFISLDELKNFCRDRLASYKIPSELKMISGMPRNAMGKVMKPELRKLF